MQKLTTYRSSEAACNACCTCGCQHFSSSTLIFINSLKSSDQFTEQSCWYASYMHERTFLSYNNNNIWLEQDHIISQKWHLPKGIPLPKTAVRPTILAMRVRNVRYSFKATPRSMVFISGMPEPAIKLLEYFETN